jgi:glycosyltransferase involved in cell wall biosynthesis
MSTVPPKILIYLTGGLHWVGGIQYTRNLLRALSLLPAGESPVIVLKLGSKNANLGLESEFSQYANVVLDHYVELPVRSGIGRSGMIGKIIDRVSPKRTQIQKILLSDSCTVAFPAKGAKPLGPAEQVMWVPDFQYKHFPAYFSEQERKARDGQYAQMFGKDGILVLSSHAVKADFDRFFPGYDNLRVRVLNFHTTLIDEEYAPDPRMVCQKYGIPEIYAYLPNQIWQHKGHDTVLAALAKLKQIGLDIPIVCTGSSIDYRTDVYFQGLRQFIKTHGLAEQVTMLDLIPRLEQIQIFRQATLVIQASRSEGWSTVVEDARALGKTILLSDIPVHQEQAPEQGHFFKVGDSDDLAAKLRDLWSVSAIGVQPEKEHQSRLQARDRSLTYARNFLQIMQEAHILHLSKIRRKLPVS